MRGFQTKLLLPLVLLVVMIGAFMEFYWLPSWQRSEAEARLAQEKAYLELLGGMLRAPIISSDLASVYDQLDQLSIERKHWQSLTLRNADGVLLYPLSVPEQPIETSHYLRVSIQVEERQLAELGLAVDLTPYLSAELKRLRTLELILLAVAGVAVVLVGWMQRQLVLRPIDKIASTARQMAAGDFYTPIPIAKESSALQEFLQAFRVMRDSIADKHEALKEEVAQRENVQRRLNDSQRVAQLGCWEWNVATERLWCSDSLPPIMNLRAADEYPLEEFYSSVHPADLQQLRNQMNSMVENAFELSMEFRVSTPGSLKYVHIMGRFDEKHQRAYGTCQDITESKEIGASLRKLSSAITYSGSSVIITDIIGTIEYVNPKYSEITGYEPFEAVGQQPDILSRRWMSGDRYDLLWQSIMAGKQWRGELQSERKDGSMFWSLVSISPIKNEFGELTHFVIVLEDVSELKQAHARMEQLALYDELTGLANRRLFYSELRTLLNRMEADERAAVMLLDLDFFKTINDTRGHQIGDELLKAVARRLQHALQEQDIAARLGGDEFALLISPIDNETRVLHVAERILAALSRPFTIDGAELQITTSLGIAMIPKDGGEPDSLLKHADLAMYQAKEMGRNQLRFFTESLHEQLQTYIRFTREMPLALENSEFVLNFQPQVNLRTNKVIGAEALIRWHHPELGVVPPPAFISVAEETGFIVPLGRWVIANACAAIRSLNDAGVKDLRIAVNLSARQFRDPHLISMISQILEDTGVDPRQLEIEITETLLMHDVEQAISTLQDLQALGMTIAIDDFGIGYSSFNYLKVLPINVLKVDREFIKDIPDHLDDMEITAAIVSMAHRLSLSVVAEGIETPVQQVFLEEHGCDYGQGYLFSRPVPLDDFKQLLLEHQGYIPVIEHETDFS